MKELCGIMDIKIRDLSVTNIKDSKIDNEELHNINLSIPKGKIVGIIGQKSSGKTTLALALNGSIKPSNGTVLINGYDWNEPEHRQYLRDKIYYVHHFPEQQLVADTIAKEIYYGLHESVLTEEQKLTYITEVMDTVNLPYKDYANISPYSLSIGQRRKVAIASVLALNPKIVILDEPTIGLDQIGKTEIIELIKNIQHKRNMTLIIISKNIDEIAEVVDKLIILDNGQIVIEGSPECIFKSSEKLKRINLDVPDITKFIMKLNETINKPIPLNCVSLEELEKEVLKILDGNNSL